MTIDDKKITRSPSSIARALRKPQLSIIYFIDSNKTKTVTINLTYFKIGASFLGILLLWAVTSPSIFWYFEQSRQESLADLRQALAAIFDYQVRFEDVYETAYPDSERVNGQNRGTLALKNSNEKNSNRAQQGRNQVATNIGPTTNGGFNQNTVQSAIQTPSANTKQAQLQKSTTQIAEDSPTTTAATPEMTLRFNPVPQPNATVGVVVENPSVALGEKNLEFFFDLRNTLSQDKAEGLIWAVATFETDQGTKSYIGVPSYIRVSTDGQALNPEKGYRFAIMRFRRKSFVFNYPGKDFNGRCTNIRLTVRGRSNTDRVEYATPMDVKVSSGATPRSKTGGVQPAIDTKPQEG